MSRPLRVGVIGCGAIAQIMHLPTLAERPDLFTIAGLADIDRDTLDAVGNRYRVERRTTDFGELIALSDVEAVLVLASGSHRKFVLPALEAGRHLFVEKPLGFSLEETREIASAASAADRVLMVGYHKRFDPAFQRARAEVQQMRELRFVDATVFHPDEEAFRRHHALVPEPPPVARTEEEMYRLAVHQASTREMTPLLDATVGEDAPPAVRMALFVLLTSGIHDLNALRGMLGEPEEVLSAHTWRNGMAQTSVTRFAGDLRVILSWVFVPCVAHYHEELRFVGPDRRVTLSFPSPYLRHASTPFTIERMEGETLVIEQHTVSYEEAFRAELHHFRESILTGCSPINTVDEALGDMEWIVAIARTFPRSARRTGSV